MGFKVVVVNAPADETFRYEREALDPIGAEIVRRTAQNEDELCAAVADADAAILSGGRWTARVINALERCRVIAAGGIGLDGIDLDAATERGIPVCNVPDVFVDEVADQTMALLLAVNRKVVLCHNAVVAGRWREVFAELSPLDRLRENTLGLLAFGNIARATARRALAFGLRVIAYDPYLAPEQVRSHGVEPYGLDDLLRTADIVSCHIPLTKETSHFIGEREFRLMKPSAIFINTSRGKVVDEAALIRALQEGRLRGAGLDVLEQEPCAPDNPLLRMKNVVITPHMASFSDAANVERRRRVGEEIAAVLSGRMPRNLANAAVRAHLALT